MPETVFEEDVDTAYAALMEARADAEWLQEQYYKAEMQEQQPASYRTYQEYFQEAPCH
jgi:hypothetical protein